jgi:hypothetical protein
MRYFFAHKTFGTAAYLNRWICKHTAQPCSFELISGISSHPAVFFSHNKSANNTFSHNKPAK